MGDGIAARFDNRAYQASEERQLDAVLAMPSTSLLARPGRRPGGGLEVTVGGSPESATIQPGGGILTDVAGGGSFRFVIPSAVVIALATRPATGNSRIDVVYAVVKNGDVRPADGTGVREVDVAIATGTAGSSPTAPSIATGALQLARLAVPATGSVSVSAAPQRVAALGGIVPVSGATERDAISPMYGGLVVYREDLQTFEARDVDSWSTIGGDTDWINVSLDSPFVAGSGIQPSVRRLNGVVYWRGRVGRSGGFAVASYLVISASSLPAWALPSAGDDIWRSLPGDTPRGVAADGVVQSTGVSINIGSATTAIVSLSGLSGYPAK